jgi:hypothetical protein
MAVALFACYPLANWIGKQQTRQAAERIARSFATEQALAQASRESRSKLENFRLAKVRANLGASSSVHAAALELAHEHQLHVLERC